MTEEQARLVLKKHAANYGDRQYEPALWVIAAMQEAFAAGKAAEQRAWLVQSEYTDDVDTMVRRMGVLATN
jgi:hypothetical protein